MLNAKQQLVIDKVVRQKQSVFITGKAGTGKSFTIASLIKELQSANEVVFLTGTTGISAYNLLSKEHNVTPTTLHSFAGIGNGSDPLSDMIRKIRRSKEVKQRWLDVTCLIVDEISMMSPMLMDSLDKIGRAIRKTNAPFGGIKMVLVGDLAQLPPVIKKQESDFSMPRFCFESDAWKSLFSPKDQNEILLEEMFRQTDPVFVNILNEIRNGQLSEANIDILEKRSKRNLVAELNNLLRKHGFSTSFNSDYVIPKEVADQLPSHLKIFASPIVPTILYTVNHKVDDHNRREMAKIKEPERVFEMTHITEPAGVKMDEDEIEKCVNGMLMEKTLRLKVGCQVMLIANVEPPLLINGQRGVVIGFSGSVKSTLPKAEERDENFDFSIYNFVDSTEKIGVKRNCSEMMDTVSLGYPIVKFDSMDQAVTVTPFGWKKELSFSNTKINISQIPLKLGWALSVHKSQSLTISRLEVDLSNCFEKGQLYVALSRARSLDCLVISCFDRQHFSPEKLSPDPRVVEFYQRISKNQAQT